MNKTLKTALLVAFDCFATVAAWIFAAAFLVLGGMIGCIPGMRFTALFCMGLALLCILHWVLSGWARKSKVGNVCEVIFRYGTIVGFALILMGTSAAWKAAIIAIIRYLRRCTFNRKDTACHGLFFYN